MADSVAATAPSLLELLRSRVGTFGTIAAADDELALTIPVRAKFHGGQQHIFAPGLSGQVSFAKPDPTLIRAVVRAHAWLKLLCDGTVASLEELVRHVGHDRIFVRRVLRLAFLGSPTTFSTDGSRSISWSPISSRPTSSTAGPRSQPSLCSDGTASRYSAESLARRRQSGEKHR